MLKRISLFLLFALLGLLAWIWLRQRQDDRANVDSQFALLDSAPQTAPSRGSTTSANISSVPPPAATTPIIRAPIAEPTPQEVDPASDAPGELPTQLENSAAPPEQTMETPPAPIADDSADDDSADDDSADDDSADDDSADEDAVIAYCVRCKTKRAMVDPHEEITENGRRAARGTCPVCEANMFTFLPDKHEN